MSNYNILKKKVIFGKYKLLKIIGNGSFGCVFSANNILDNSLVAVKVEKRNGKLHLLEFESNYLSMLKGFGIPEIKSFGYNKYFYFLVEELLGSNLIQIKYKINKFTLKDIAMIGIQMIDRIEYVHSKNILHRDIKPENFVKGYKDDSIIYIIDFGISRKYKSSRTGKHLKFRITGKVFGTLRYISYNATRGVEQSRRDDLESIGYILILLATGDLPWQGVSRKEHDRKKKYLEILLLKKYTPIEVLCKNLPIEFVDYIKYCKNLQFEQDPNYEYLRNLFKSILLKINEINDMKFSWCLIKSFFLKKKNSKNDDIKKGKNKYINFLRRKETPQKRLFKSIQDSLKKERKNEKRKKEKQYSDLTSQKNIDLMEDSNNIIYNRGVSEDAKNSSKFDESYFSISKSYNSLLVYYNLKVNGFQDENKLDKENIAIINSIKNRNNINISSEKNYNIHIQDNNKVNSLSSNNSKYLVKAMLNLINYSKLDINKKNKKFNISIDLDKKYLNISHSLYNKKIYSKSEIIKNYIIEKKVEFTKKEEKRKLICKNIYMNILNNNKKYIYSLLEMKKKDKEKQKNILNNYILYYKFKSQIVNDHKNKSALISDNFSFTKYKNIEKPEDISFNTKIEFKNIKNNTDVKEINNNKYIILNNNINRIKINNISQNYKKLSPDNKTNKIIINNKIYNKYKLIKNKNITNNKRIYIINNSNENSNKDKIYKNLKTSQNKENIINKKIYNKYFTDNNYKKYITINKINKIPKIPNICNITKNNCCRNAFEINNKIKYINTQVYNTNNSNKNNDTSLFRKIKIFEYKPLYNGTRKSEVLKKNNDFKIFSKYNNIIKTSSLDDKIFFDGKKKVIKPAQLNNRNIINTSPQPYNYNGKIKMRKNIINLPYENNNLNYQINLHNHNLSNDICSYNLRNTNLKLGNLPAVNDCQKIYITTKKNNIFRQYSPINTKLNRQNSNNVNIESTREININRNNRSNSNNLQKRFLNYDIEKLNHISKNINILNTQTNNLITRRKCFNDLNI